ncbi:MAG TPA: CBS domain-containing protein [Thermoanaerobaculia bacterium]|nr:CBS domain-containing protein [Thermoanaerobaculia bacterium]
MKQIAELIEDHPLFLAERNESVRDVARRMSEKNIGAIAVLDAGALVGVFSERDIMARVVVPGLNPDETTLDSVMTREIVVAESGESVDNALQKMHSVGSRHLPVVDDGKLVGMISIRDLLEVDDRDQRNRATFLSELVTYSPDYET